MDSRGIGWTGDYVFSSGNLILDLLHNFFLERVSLGPFIPTAALYRGISINLQRYIESTTVQNANITIEMSPNIQRLIMEIAQKLYKKAKNL